MLSREFEMKEEVPDEKTVPVPPELLVDLVPTEGLS